MFAFRTVSAGFAATVGAGLLAAGSLTSAARAPESQGARGVHGENPYVELDDEPAPRLVVDAPDPAGLAQGIVWIPYRTENVRLLPAFGKGALGVSPRVGHLHVHVDDLPWFWADSSGLGTVDIAGLPPGEHKVLIELVDANHRVFPGQSKTVKFTVPGTGATSPGN